MPYSYKHKGHYGRKSGKVNDNVKSYVNRRLKSVHEPRAYCTVNVGNEPAYDNVSILNLSAIAQGDDTDERDGNKIKAGKLVINGRIRQNTNQVTTPQKVRVTILQWFQDNGAESPVAGDVFTNPSAISNTYEPIVKDYLTKKFAVLADKIYTIQPSTFAWDEGTEAAVGDYVKEIAIKIVIPELKRKILNYGINAATTGLNNLYAMVTSSVPNGTADEPLVDLASALQYRDY